MPLKSERLYEPQIQKGDRVRVTFEGVADQVFPDGKVQVVRDKYYTIFSSDEVEKLEPPVETFKPGDVVRGKTVPRVKFLIVKGGYVDLLNNIWNPDPTDFTSRDYERVRLEEASF